MLYQYHHILPPGSCYIGECQGLRSAHCCMLTTLQARDDQGQRRLSGGDVFEVTIVPVSSNSGGNGSSPGLALVPSEAGSRAAGVAAQVEDVGDGTYAVRYRLALAGRHQLHILAPEGAPVADSPYPLLVRPAQQLPACMLR
jgi:hypothetical protein